MGHNLTSYTSEEYDKGVLNTIPYYDYFNKEIIDLIKNTDIKVDNWLDTGCGTGYLFLEAKNSFKNTNFILADPSIDMIKLSKNKINLDDKVTFINLPTQELKYKDNTFDIITAIQCHHYLDKETRINAIKNCFKMLKENGMLIIFENIRPFSDIGINIGLERWKSYQTSCGKSNEEAKSHVDRFDKEYFPISIIEHIDLLREVGFNKVEVLWTSYMQGGFYAIK